MNFFDNSVLDPLKRKESFATLRAQQKRMSHVNQPKAGMLADWQIAQRVEAYGLLEEFVPRQVREHEGRKIISYGLTSYGYDVRLATEFKVFNNRKGGIIDPLDFDSERVLVTEEGDHCVIPPNSYILGRTVERFNMPENMVSDCLGKSTYARCGLIINVTPAEPEWNGYLTLELANVTPLPLKVYANMGIAQIRFYEGAVPDVTYATRQGGPGKYQNQPAEPVDPRL